MKTFNVRELSRRTAKVLETCELDGGVIIQYKDGRQFALMPRARLKKQSRKPPDFAARARAIFGQRSFTKQQISKSLEVAKGQY